MKQPRYTIAVESKGSSAHTLEEALSIFSGMMTINKAQVRKDLEATGQAMQVYGFCTGSVVDRYFEKR